MELLRRLGTLSAVAGYLGEPDRGDIVMGLGKGALLWLLGIPLPIIILLVLFWR